MQQLGAHTSKDVLSKHNMCMHFLQPSNVASVTAELIATAISTVGVW